MSAELHSEVAGEVLDRRYVMERVVETLFEEPLETVTLKRDKIRYV
jgi:hypothetical protein